MLIAPRLTDDHGISLPQAAVDFAVPFFDEDIPLYLAPFLLWKSPSQQDQALHTSLINAFNHLGLFMRRGEVEEAVATLVAISECDEVGLGSSATRKGKRIGAKKAEEILRLFEDIPEYGKSGFRHFEEIQFYVEGISKDRVSDIACNFLKSFLLDFTIEQCLKLGIPMVGCAVENVYDYRTNKLVSEQNCTIPVNPSNGKPINSCAQ